MEKIERSKKIEKENVLVVEGKDEYDFFSALLGAMNIPDVQIIDVGGIYGFRANFPLYIQTDGALAMIKNIGFVRDAEQHEARSAFNSILSVLRNYDLPCPTEPRKLVNDNGKKVNIFIMPNNNDRGMLEDLCIASVKDTDVFTCVECFVQCYETKITKDKFNLPKAKILAYLSTRTPIVNALGVAARQGVWDFTKPCFDDIKNFLRELFE
jgi:hypothetical protein